MSKAICAVTIRGIWPGGSDQFELEVFDATAISEREGIAEWGRQELENAAETMFQEACLLANAKTGAYALTATMAMSSWESPATPNGPAETETMAILQDDATLTRLPRGVLEQIQLAGTIVLEAGDLEQLTDPPATLGDDEREPVISSEEAAHAAGYATAVIELTPVMRGLIEMAENPERELGHCCCGEMMATHGNPMDVGHAPVDAGVYAANQWILQAKQILAVAEAKAAGSQ